MINIKRPFFVLTLLSYLFITSNLNAQKNNQFNKNKKRTGVWKKYYPNKRIRYTGEFKNGKEIGVFKFYDITTSKFPVILKTFSESSDSVFVQFFTRKGTLESKGYLLGKKRVGVWEYYFSTGKLMSKEHYKNGLLDGELINYYPDGTITEKSNYKNGLQHGISQKYSSKSILIEEVEYLNGKPNGVAKYFELNGNLKETGSYKNGKRVGKWEYYLDGEVATDEDKKKKNKFTKKN